MLASITVTSDKLREKRVGIPKHSWNRFNYRVAFPAVAHKHTFDYLVVVT